MTTNELGSGAGAPEQGRSSRVGAVMLWALSVGGSVGGLFSGWNPGLAEAGFGGMLVATLVVVALYAFLVMSIAELASMMPFAGGTVTYARAAFGVWGGFMAAVSALIAYLFAMSSLMELMTHAVIGLVAGMKGPHIPSPLVWAAFLLGFGWLNLKDRRTFFNAALVLAVLSVSVLFLTAVAVVPSFDPSALLSIPASAKGNAWLPFGLSGIAFAIPFAMWLFLSIEVVSFAGEDALAPAKSIPKGLLAAMFTLAFSAIVILVVVSGGKPGALAIAHASDPLAAGLESVFGKTPLLFLVPLLGAVVGFHSLIYAASRVVFSLSRSGCLPQWFSAVAAQRGTPGAAVVGVCVAVFVISCLSLFAPGNVDLMIAMAATGGLTSYLFVFASYAKLHARFPHLERPFQSMFGGTGAIAGLIMTTAGLLLMLVDGKQLGAVAGCLSIFLAAALLFMIFRPEKLRGEAPEEAFARDLHDKLAP